MLWVILGAALGALARWKISLWLNPVFSHVAFGTLLVNWLGCLLIGIALGLMLHDSQKCFFMTGFLGSFTTFSSFSAELSEKILEAKYGDVALTLGLHVGGGVMLTLLGIIIVRHFSHAG